MYESHFGLTGSPFQLNPDAAFYFNSRGHGHALSYLKFGAHQGEGFIVVTGEIGAGKTTLVRTLLEGLDRSTVVAAQIVSTQLESVDLVRAILAAFGAPLTHDSKAHLISSLEAFLTALAARGKRALLIIDEAQNLRPETVEELRMLSNFQLGNHALLQSFLVGQPELRVLLKSKSMEQLRQRVIASCHLGPLEATETRAYIEHRLGRVHWKGNPRFSDEAHAEIHACTGGVPRRINRLCNRLLLAAYLGNAGVISATLVADTAAELRAEIGEAAEPVPPAKADEVAPLPAPSRTTSTHPGAAVIAAFGKVADVPSSTGGLIALFDNRSDFFKLAALAQVLAQNRSLPRLSLVHSGATGDLIRGEADARVLPVGCDEFHLEAEGRDYVELTQLAQARFDLLLDRLAPGAVVVIGDSDVNLACCLLARRRGVQIVRLGAGARPVGAINAALIDRLADSLLTDRPDDNEALAREGLAPQGVHCVGNLVGDFVRLAGPYLLDRDISMAGSRLVPDQFAGGFALASVRLGRGHAVADRVAELTPMLRALAFEMPLVWPVSPWELAALREGGHDASLARDAITVIADTGYIEVLNLLRHASLLIHGAERELADEALLFGKRTLAIGVPDLAVVRGSSVPQRVVGWNHEVAARAMRALKASKGKETARPEAWDGSAASRIAELFLGGARSRPKMIVKVASESTS